MNKMYSFLYYQFLWIIILIFIIFYPMLISIYVFLPLLIGVMGYTMILGIEKGKIHYILLAVVYLINLEVNLSLLFSLTLISTLLMYVLFYDHLTHFRSCKICKHIISVILIDFIYLGLLLSYDFIFENSSIVLDNILLYSFIVDILVVIVL